MQSHFYLSAKNDDSIELIFRKIATEILGTKITRNEPEQSSVKPQASTTTNVEEKNITEKPGKDVEDDKTASKETTKETSSKNTANQRSSSTCLLQ
uniref:Uncharacterized protein n=1 Tax=Meloidogyne enterolobii TaxID=390850 RepID=A0A6V7XHV8_MELEN|nr:unnamed protein product [Meloidogyne enterolobii]